MVTIWKRNKYLAPKKKKIFFFKQVFHIFFNKKNSKLLYLVTSVTREFFSHQILKFIFNLTGKKKGSTIYKYINSFVQKKKSRLYSCLFML